MVTPAGQIPRISVGTSCASRPAHSCRTSCTSSNVPAANFVPQRKKNVEGEKTHTHALTHPTQARARGPAQTFSSEGASGVGTFGGHGSCLIQSLILASHTKQRSGLCPSSWASVATLQDSGNKTIWMRINRSKTTLVDVLGVSNRAIQARLGDVAALVAFVLVCRNDRRLKNLLAALLFAPGAPAENRVAATASAPVAQLLVRAAKQNGS